MAEQNEDGKEDLVIIDCQTRKDMKRLAGARSICLDAGQEFNELLDTYTIFITEKDFYGMGELRYVIERMNLTTGKGFGDGEHILYVNGEYRGESDLGKLMHDFNCTEADDMKFDLIAERTRYLKENPKGVQEMCKVMEDMRNEATNLAAQKKAMDIASAMIMAGKYESMRLDQS